MGLVRAKVRSHLDDILYRGDWLTVRAVRRRNGSLPAVDWFEGLDDRGKAKVAASVRIVETTLRVGRPGGGRLEKVRAVRAMTLLELKVTPPGSTPPHLRLIVLREGRTLWACHGFTKQKNKLEVKDINAAMKIAEEWLEERRSQ